MGHAPLVIALGSGVCSAMGLLQLAVFADRVGARSWDLGLGPTAYVPIVVTSVALVAVLTAMVLLGGWLGTRLAQWASLLSIRDTVLLVLGAVVTSVLLILLARPGGPMAPAPRLAFAVAALGWLLLVFAWLIGLVSTVWPTSTIKDAVGWLTTCSLLVVAVSASLVIDLDVAVRDVRRAALTGAPTERTGSFLELFVGAESGEITLSSGETFCGVRVGPTVFLRPDPAHPGALETVIEDARRFASTSSGC
jgi:hypothetical protein